MLSEKQQIFAQKWLFGKNWNLACRVILSIYTFYVIFKQIWAWHCSRPSYLNNWKVFLKICDIGVVKNWDSFKWGSYGTEKVAWTGCLKGGTCPYPIFRWVPPGGLEMLPLFSLQNHAKFSLFWRLYQPLGPLLFTNLGSAPDNIPLSWLKSQTPSMIDIINLIWTLQGSNFLPVHQSRLVNF